LRHEKYQKLRTVSGNEASLRQQLQAVKDIQDELPEPDFVPGMSDIK